MKARFFVVASAIVSALAMAGCKQEAKAPEPVRPVLSAVLQPAASDSTVAVGTVQSPDTWWNWVPRSMRPWL